MSLSTDIQQVAGGVEPPVQAGGVGGSVDDVEAVEQGTLGEDAALPVEQLHGKPDAGLGTDDIVLAADAEVDGPISKLVGPVLDVELRSA